MAIKEGLKTTLNQIRELSSPLYQQEVPLITNDTDIATFGNPILDNLQVQNEFIPALINRIVYTSFEIKFFRNPLQVLEGDRIPIGWSGQEIYTNPDEGREYNADDFAGLLAKYESDVKVQYVHVNKSIQFAKTINRQVLKQAFTTWENLESFIDSLVQAMYNSLYMQNFIQTKELITKAYLGNKVMMENVQAPTTEDTAKKFVTLARSHFLNFQVPSSKYNAWSKMTGDEKPIITQTNPEDIVFIIRNDLRAYLDVNILANAFNIDKTTLLGNIIAIDDFSVYNKLGEKVLNGDNIVGFIADKSWFRLKVQDEFMETFYNPNNWTWQYYLNQIKMVNFSLFANAIMFVTADPVVNLTNLSLETTTVEEGQNLIKINTTPTNFTGELTVTVDETNADKVVASIINNTTLDLVVSPDITNPITLTFKCGTYTTDIKVTANGIEAASMKATRSKTTTK